MHVGAVNVATANGLLELVRCSGVVVPRPLAVRVGDAGLVEHVLVVEEVPGVLAIRDRVRLPVDLVVGQALRVAAVLRGHIGHVHQLAAVLVGEEVPQVLEDVEIGGRSGGEVRDHLGVVVVAGLVLDQIDRDVRVGLVERIGQGLELRGRVEEPRCHLQVDWLRHRSRRRRGARLRGRRRRRNGRARAARQH